MEKLEFKAAVITVSDKGFAGEREDESGPLAVKMLKDAGIAMVETGIIPDEREIIAATLIRLCDESEANLVLTTGGTGFAPRDVTPEATLDVIEKRADGLAELMRLESLKHTDYAALSRAVCGIRGDTLIINLPGSPKAVKENLKAVLKVVEHSLVLLSGGMPH